KHIVLEAVRTDLGGNAVGNSTPWTDKDGKVHPAQLVDVDDDSKPKGTDTPSYLDWTTLHEVGHGVDDTMGFMNGKMGNAAFGNWKIETVDSVAGVAAAFFGCQVKDIKPLLTGPPPATPPPPPPGTDPTSWQKAVDWCTGVRTKNALWDKGTESANRAL